MWFAFLFKPYKKIPQTIQYATVDFRVQHANHSAQEHLMLPVPAREMLKVYTLFE